MGDYRNWYAWEQKHKAPKSSNSGSGNPYKIGDYARWYAWEQAHKKTTSKVSTDTAAEIESRLLQMRLKNVTNYLTDEGSFIYKDSGISSITNLSANTFKTINLKQLNAATLCPVPVAAGKFHHKATHLHVNISKSTSTAYNRQMMIYFFIIWVKGTWTPGEAAGSIEAALAAQNTSLYKVEIVGLEPLSATYDPTGPAYVTRWTGIYDITKFINACQRSVNQREGLVNEIDACPCYIGIGFRATDDGQPFSYQTSIVDIRGLTPIPFKV